MQQIKNVLNVIQGVPTQDGAGVKLTRVLGHETIQQADPFLMLDAFDSTNPNDYIKGFPLHPHRGIETVTYLIKGHIEHKDSLGNSGSIRAGQAQWMTAGKGILHEEMPQPSDHMLGFQLWINLPKKDKMTFPHYYDITEHMIKVADYNWGTIRVVAGEYDGHQGANPMYVQANMFDISLNQEKTFSLKVNPEETVVVYIIEGSGFFGEDAESSIGAKNALFFDEGTEIKVTAEEPLRFMLFSGMPLGEPVAWGGPIVMNTQEELQEAFAQLDQGTFIAQESSRVR